MLFGMEPGHRGSRSGSQVTRPLSVSRPHRADGPEAGTDLARATVGIVGMGSIGRATAQRARLGFGCSILYTRSDREGSTPCMRAGCLLWYRARSHGGGC
jgi:lactate dehydrogenase-like 2-hydroxyacid dehydrogenase